MKSTTQHRVIATDSDPDVDEALRRVRVLAEQARGPQVTARVLDDLHAEVDAARRAAEAQRIADTEIVQQQAATEIAASPGVRTRQIRVWGGAVITVPCRSYCTHDHDADAPMHPHDITHRGDEQQITLLDPDGNREGVLTCHIRQEPYGSWGGQPRAVVEIGGEGYEYDLGALDRTIADFEQQVAKLHQLRDQLAAVAGNR